MDTTIIIDQTWLPLISAVVIPWLVALGTKVGSGSRPKALLAVALSALAALVNEMIVQTGGTFQVRAFLISFAIAVFGQDAAYRTLWRGAVSNGGSLPQPAAVAGKGLGKVIDTTVVDDGPYAGQGPAGDALDA